MPQERLSQLFPNPFLCYFFLFSLKMSPEAWVRKRGLISMFHVWMRVAIGTLPMIQWITFHAWAYGYNLLVLVCYKKKQNYVMLGGRWEICRRMWGTGGSRVRIWTRHTREINENFRTSEALSPILASILTKDGFPSLLSGFQFRWF